MKGCKQPEHTSTALNAYAHHHHYHPLLPLEPAHNGRDAQHCTAPACCHPEECAWSVRLSPSLVDQIGGPQSLDCGHPATQPPATRTHNMCPGALRASYDPHIRHASLFSSEHTMAAIWRSRSACASNWAASLAPLMPPLLGLLVVGVAAVGVRSGAVAARTDHGAGCVRMGQLQGNTALKGRHAQSVTHGAVSNAHPSPHNLQYCSSCEPRSIRLLKADTDKAKCPYNPTQPNPGTGHMTRSTCP